MLTRQTGNCIFGLTDTSGSPGGLADDCRRPIDAGTHSEEARTAPGRPGYGASYGGEAGVGRLAPYVAAAYDRDQDRIYGSIVVRRLRAMGIRDKPTAAASPWQNGFAERLIGSIRRECVDHFIVLGEAHLQRILRTYARYYNDIRTHWSLDKDAPVSRPVQRIGSINSHAILGGLHHHYVRI